MVEALDAGLGLHRARSGDPICDGTDGHNVCLPPPIPHAIYRPHCWQGTDIWTILQLIAFNLAWMVVLAVPMAVLVACVMAFGALASSNELTALKAAGVSLGRMLFPVMLLSVLIGVLDLQFNNIILPDANHRAKDLMTDIQRKKPSLVVEPGYLYDR